jgi:group I intron endonuclease
MKTKVPRLPGVYVITHEPTGIYYVGSTGNLYERRSNHIAELKQHRHVNRRLQDTWGGSLDDYTFKFEACDSRDEALDLEQEVLDKLWGMFLCANVGNDARIGWKHGTMPPELLNKHSQHLNEIRGLRDYSIPYTHTEESKENMRRAWSLRPKESIRRGFAHSAETRAKISEALTGLPGRKGVPHTGQALENMRAGFKEAGIKKSRKVSLDGVVYNNAEYASRELGVTRRTIVLRIQSENEQYANWLYVERTQ